MAEARLAGGALRNSLRESRLFGARIGVMGAVLVVLVSLLVARLSWIQTVDHKHYETLSQQNRVDLVPVPPVRGLIIDRNGVVLAQTHAAMTLDIVPDQVKKLDGLLAELTQYVNITDRDLKLFHRQLRERPRFEPITLRANLSDEEAGAIAVIRHRLPGVMLRARSQRHYPQGRLASHAVGYVGRISDEDQDRIDPGLYSGSLYIGKTGAEASYEGMLLGQVGFDHIETDAHGRALRVLSRTAPRSGKTLRLHLDARLQRIAEESLGERKGAVVAMDVQSGGMLVFASTPTFDPNPFVNGIDPSLYAGLRDDPRRPLLNRALNGRYSPGSTVKAFYAFAALEAGIPSSRQVHCPGWFSFQGSTHRFRCWKKEGHGAVNLHDAVVQSCDVYFYRLAVQLGIEKLSTLMGNFGFGPRTGVDLKGESVGILPTPEWKKSRGLPWYPGDTVAAGIGQGMIIVTPLQLAAGITAIASRGTVFEPRLAQTIEDPNDMKRSFIAPVSHPVPSITAAQYAEQIANLTDVVHGAGGTARGISFTATYKIAGKTGTAQVRSIGQKEKYVESEVPEQYRDHALFIAFAPVEAPRIAVAVIVENGGHGSTTAAPIARKIMDAWLVKPAQADPHQGKK